MGTASQNTFLEQALLEIEEHAGRGGWDRPPQLFALVETSDLVRREPQLAVALGVEEAAITSGSLTPVEQDPLPDGPLDEALGRVAWPEAVAGCALVQEVVALPPDAEGSLPESADQIEYAAAHPMRQELRLIVGVLRDGATAAAARLRADDTADDAAEGELVMDANLAPRLSDALLATLR